MIYTTLCGIVIVCVEINLCKHLITWNAGNMSLIAWKAAVDASLDFAEYTLSALQQFLQFVCDGTVCV